MIVIVSRSKRRRKTQKPLKALVVLTIALAVPFSCFAYPVGGAVSLKEMTERSDVVFKGTVLSSTPVTDKWFDKIRAFDAYATDMKLVSVIKGNIAGGKVAFQHYGRARPYEGSEFVPQHYEFEAGRTYIVFAKKTDQGGVFRQLWKNHTLKGDQGVLLAADDKPVSSQSVKDVVWAELIGLLKSQSARDVVYAIRQLDQMSGDRFLDLHDFDRGPVLQEIHGYMSSKEEQVARRAIVAVGSANPYLRDDEAEFWLATIGGGKIYGLAKRDPDMENEGGKAYWRELVVAADSDAGADTRALAIRALGLACEPRLFSHATRWLSDQEPSVRQAAVVLLSDFAGDDAQQYIADAAEDESAEVRLGAARAIGFGQLDGLLSILDQLLHDEDRRVRGAAALSLVSFAPAKAEGILKANINDADFKPIFVNALAESDPEPYVDELAEITEQRLEPRDFWGGRIPYAVSWDILFKYIQRQSVDALRSGRLDKYLDALENAKFHGSSEPRDLYAFYVKNKMIRRAGSFREKCKTTIRFDMEYYFNDVDKRHGVGAPR